MIYAKNGASNLFPPYDDIVWDHVQVQKKVLMYDNWRECLKIRNWIYYCLHKEEIDSNARQDNK